MDGERRRSRAFPLAFALPTIGLTLLLGAFFGFVGFMKSFAPPDVLEQHHAWTTVLPLWLGRAVGLSELAAVAGLAAGLVWRGKLLWTQAIALALIANQGIAASVHLARGEAAALPQNGVLIGLLALLWMCARAWRTRAHP